MRMRSHSSQDRSRPGSADVVARRLEQLRAELDGSGDPPDEPVEDRSWQPAWWEGPTDDTQELTVGDDDALVPVPGRHASRRQVVISPDAVLPEPLRGRVSLGPWHLVVIAALVAVGLAVTCWWLARADPDVVSAAAPVGEPSGSTSPAALVSLPASPASPVSPVSPGAPGASTGASTGTVTVDVEGKVRHPGIVVLPTGSRVVDAIKAAGGATQPRLGGLNQAAVLTDGQQIVVGAPVAGAAAAPGGPALPGAPAAGSGAPGAPVSLNAATLEDLDTLPGVGPVTAQAILDWRTQNGGFTSVDELLDVDGIGPKTFEKLKPMVTL